jgi:hypothetical protein
MRIRELVEPGTCRAVRRERVCQRLGQFDVPLGDVEFDLDLDGVTGLDSGLLPNSPA